MGPSLSESFVVRAPASPVEILRQRLFRRPQALGEGQLNSSFGRTLHQWLETNCWSPQQLSSLIQSSSQHRLQSSVIEIGNILSGATVDIQSRLFRSLASVHQGIPVGRATEAVTPSPDPSQDNFLLAYAVPITTDRSADLASWWFALYCDEAWASTKLNPPLPMPSVTGLSVELSYLVRQSIVDNRLDPVMELQRLSRRIFPKSRAKSEAFRNWALGMSILEGDELHDTIHLIMHIVNHYDRSVKSIEQLLRTAADLKTQRALEGFQERPGS
jgi:hypothetical protein